MGENVVAQAVGHLPQRPAEVKLEPAVSADELTPGEVATATLVGLSEFEVKAVRRECRRENLNALLECGRNVHVTKLVKLQNASRSTAGGALEGARTRAFGFALQGDELR